MSATEGVVRHHLRDLHGASRAVAYLMAAAAPYILVNVLFLQSGRSAAEILAVCLTAVAVAAFAGLCRWWPHRLPAYYWAAAPFVATILMTGLNLATDDASAGAQLFFLWPVLYAANFLSRRLVHVTLATVLTGETVVAFTLLDPALAMADATAMALAMTMTTVVVVPLRDRADQLRRTLERQAFADPLTGLDNRRSFDEAVQHAVAWADRTRRPLALLTVDLDHFKHINDTWGHAVGDRALQEVARCMRTVVEPDDRVARLGGDEFVMLLRADHRGALGTVRALREALAAITGLPGGPPRISIGVALLPDHATTAEGLLAASDAALYDAKSNGRGREATYRPATREPATAPL